MNLVGSSLTLMEEVSMADLRKEEVKALGHAVGLEIKDPELTEVTYSINALLEALDQINPPGLADVEPLPIILPPQ
jgi:Asp-tRNA(Asn)/Glu-tRNA(Gln) amidotransferase C subunit